MYFVEPLRLCLRDFLTKGESENRLSAESVLALVADVEEGAAAAAERCGAKERKWVLLTEFLRRLRAA